jgi:hypothetical protein
MVMLDASKQWPGMRNARITGNQSGWRRLCLCGWWCFSINQTTAAVESIMAAEPFSGWKCLGVAIDSGRYAFARTAGGGVIDNSQRHFETHASANIITSSLRFITAMARDVLPGYLQPQQSPFASSISSMIWRRRM